MAQGERDGKTGVRPAELMAALSLATDLGSGQPMERALRRCLLAVLIAHFQGAFPDGRVTTEDLLADGDRVASRWTYRGTHRAEFQGIPPTGNRVTLTGISIWRFEGGKIVESWHEFDGLGLMQQLGVIPTPQQPSV